MTLFCAIFYYVSQMYLPYFMKYVARAWDSYK
jgi:hypothetical protein